jgi:hypothetical protein
LLWQCFLSSALLYAPKVIAYVFSRVGDMLCIKCLQLHRGELTDVLQNDAMMADHPTSVVRNLQFLSQAMSSLKPSSNGAGAAATASTTQKRRLRSHHGAREATDPDTATPTAVPTSISTDAPTIAPTTINPTVQPTAQPTSHPTLAPTQDTAGSVASADVDINAKAEANHAIRVLLYSGEFDLNCNTLGTLHTLEANRWRNKYVC